jgi:hypothetical protein
MNRTSARLGAGLAVSLTVALTFSGAGPATSAAPAAARTVTVHLAHAPMGAPPRLLLMEGRTINLPDGRQQRVQLGKNAGTYWSLVDRGLGGYVLANYDNKLHLDLFTLRHGSRQLLAHTGGTPEEQQVLAAPGGRKVASWSPSQTAEHSLGKVYGSSGKLVARVKVAGDSRMLAFDGHEAVVSGSSTSLWTLGSTPVTISSDPAVLASLDHDLMFIRTAVGVTGPTSVSAPAAPAWTASFLPTGLSADGTLVVGDVPGHSARIQVRRVTDGHVVADLAMKLHANSQPLVLEDDHHILVQSLVGHHGISLFRCGFGGHCVRTWSWQRSSIFAGWHFSGPGFGTGFET